MEDYKQMYLTLLDGVEKAMETLISAQRACEELYIDTDTDDEEKVIFAYFDKFQHKNLSYIKITNDFVLI
ncbi:MAG: hypothetical protein J6Q56_02515 [Clostridia bacterium]|nr:hypothetical protein [Clostridia bacterium]